MIGRYFVERIIGRGGMGEVYAAFDPDLHRPVAIKRGASAADALNAARIHHPNVVAVLDRVEQDHEQYVVMELVEGPTLKAWLEQQGRGWREILRMFIEAGSGLASAHQQGVVHRDFKPSNVLLDANGRPRVADFGLARRMSVPADFDEHRSGTAKYMAREQHDGGPVGPAADQFAFCNALYRALFGHAPFDGATAGEYLANLRRGRVLSPSVRRGAPRALVRVLLRGLLSSPAQRHDSMDELLSRLQRILSRRRVFVLILVGIVIGVFIAVFGGVLVSTMLEPVGSAGVEEAEPLSPLRGKHGLSVATSGESFLRTG